MGAGAAAAVAGPAERHRICLVVGQLGLGGLERQVYLLATGLDRDRFEVTVVSMVPGGAWAAALQRAGVRVMGIGRRGPRDWRRLLALWRIFRAIRPDLVYSFNYEGNAYARLAGVLAGVPVLVTGERGVYMTRRMGLVERVLVRFTECVICNAEAVRRDLVDRVGLPEAKLITIRNAVIVPPEGRPDDRARARRVIGVVENKIVVGTIARLHAVKNLTMLVRVASLCAGEGSSLHFYVIGGGPEEESLRRAIREQGLEHRFTLAGSLEEAWTLLPGFDIFVLTSWSEGLPNTLMEAMAARLPCVCTDVGGCRELVVAGVTGFLVAPDDVQGMAARIVELAGDPGRRGSMGRAGWEKIETGYTVKRLVSNVEALFYRLLEAPATRVRGRRLCADFVGNED